MSSIVKIEQQETLTKEQIKFNTLVTRIEKRKKEFNVIKDKIEEGRKIVNEIFIPLELKHGEILKSYVLQLDQNYDMSFFKKKEKEKISFLITQQLTMLNSLFKDDPELDKLLHKYFSDEDKEDAADMISDFMSDFLGMEIDPEDIWDDEKMRQKFQDYNEQLDLNDKDALSNEKPKKKTAAQKRKEEAKKQEAFHIGKAVKKIYTDLVKKLHPDKEQNEELRDRKTELMKKITVAYKENNFLSLLHYHQEYLAETERHNLEEMTDSQLKYYNKLLQEQAKEIQNQIEQLKYSPETKTIFNLVSGAEKTKTAKITRETNQLKKDIKEIKFMLSVARDRNVFRSHLKSIDLDEMGFQMEDQ